MIKYLSGFLIVLAFILLACSAKEKQETILAKIGDKTISLNEFLRRAEYTVRPLYCANNTNIDKKIILNSLIAEKLLSLEAGSNNSFIISDKVQTFLQGRLEQSMRQFLYNEEVTNRVEIDSNKIKNVCKYAGREYDILYISLYDTLVVKQLTEELVIDKTDFEKTLRENYNLKTIPEKKVEWNKLEHPVMLNTLYSKDHKKNDIIGPVEVENGHFMFIKIKGWIDNPAVTGKQTHERYNMVKDTFVKSASRKRYETYIKKVMNGKDLKFDKKVFFALADIFGPLYMKSRKEKENMFSAGIWDHNENEIKYEKMKPRLDELENELLFTIDKEEWTVGILLQEIKKHPLVFRSQSFPRNKFGFQLQMAILDLVRDKYLTREAYKKGFDKLPEVTRDNQMWLDNLNAINEKYRILKESKMDSLFIADHMTVLEQTLNSKIDDLQKKYSARVFVNVELFNEIKLTRTDMSVTYSGAPFPQVVPTFPVITSDNELDYGHQLK